jgi:competence ComEA-like helix-hairpin-helix protein
MSSTFLNNPAWIHRVIVGCILFITPIFISASCAKRSRTVSLATNNRAMVRAMSPASDRININTASARDLEALPGIGKGLAERIVEHRQKYGPFAKPEHLIMVRGISEHRFAALRELITVE